MIKVEMLTKYYNDLLAIDNLNFEISKGEIVAFLGPNGAGKTTTMNILTCFISPSSGNAIIGGVSINEDSLMVRQKIGYLPEDNPLYDEMAVFEYLEFIAKMRGIYGEQYINRLKEIVEICGLKDVISKDIGHLSRGYKQRVGFAQAIFHNPDILILDEPTSGLDPNQSREIRQLIREYKKEKTIIISTHILSEAQAIADRVMIINKGKIVADGTTSNLMDMFAGKEIIYVKLEAPQEVVLSEIMNLGNVENIKVRDKEDINIVGYEIEFLKGKDMRRDLYKFISSKGWILLEMKRETISLDEVFRKLTQEDLSDKNLN